MLEQILKGGPMIYPLILCSLISLAVVYERFIAFRANRKKDTHSLRSKVLTALRRDDPQAAISECIATGGPVASVILVGLRSYVQLQAKKESSEVIRMVVGQVMEDYSLQAMGVVNKRLDILTTIGTAAPLLGMTGTVTGMIVSFKAMKGGGANIEEGIAEALVTTAVGLIVALLAVIPQSVFNRWSDDVELEIEEATADISEFILTHH